MRQATVVILAGILALVALALVGPAAAQQVGCAVAQQNGHDVVKLENYRVQLVIDPSRGGAVTSYSDKLAPAELILQKPFNGLCMDHFQEQNWPGEFLEVPYEYKIVAPGPDIAAVMVWRKASGIWGGKLANPKLSDVLIEKTYTLRADSPTLTCSVKLTAPADSSKVFSYWLQDVMFAGGDYDRATDRTFRPSARGVRNTGYDNNGHYGREEWLRDFTAGWMALIDTQKKSGLALDTDYNDLRINYANGGNMTNELMFNTVYVPKGGSRTYVIHLTPVVGLDKILYVGPEMIAGWHINPAGGGAGKMDFEAVRSDLAVQDAQMAVTLVGGADTSKQTKVGVVSFGPLTDKPQTQTLPYTGAPPDPLVVRVEAKGTTGGKQFSLACEDFFPGTYQWADNIQTDMRTPVYAAERNPQKLTLDKPAKLAIIKPWQEIYLYFEGLHDEDYQVAAAVHTTNWNVQKDIIYYRYGGSWYGEITDFPYDYDKLLSYEAIILGGVSKSGLKPIGMEMLHDYLLAGGGLVVLGSHGAYGKSQLKGSPLGDAFPVEMSDSVFDLVPTGGKPVTYGPDQAEFLNFTSLTPQATCYFLHDVKVKPGAQVLMQVDGKPFMVAGEYGPNKARIVCILGAPLGNPQKGQTPFWQDKGWYLILRNAIWWAGKKDDHFKK
jgi:uncharacterized membrane protein